MCPYHCLAADEALPLAARHGFGASDQETSRDARDVERALLRHGQEDQQPDPQDHRRDEAGAEPGEGHDSALHR